MVPRYSLYIVFTDSFSCPYVNVLIECRTVKCSREFYEFCLLSVLKYSTFPTSTAHINVLMVA